MKFEFRGNVVDVGGGTLFLSVPGVGEVWAEIVSNADTPRPLGWWWTETSSMIVEWGKVHITLSPPRQRTPAMPL